MAQLGACTAGEPLRHGRVAASWQGGGVMAGWWDGLYWKSYYGVAGCSRAGPGAPAARGAVDVTTCMHSVDDMHPSINTCKQVSRC